MDIQLKQPYKELLTIFAYLDEHQGANLFNLAQFDKQINIDNTTDKKANAWFQIKKDLAHQTALGHEVDTYYKDAILQEHPDYQSETFETQRKILESQVGFESLYNIKKLKPCTNSEMYELVAYNTFVYHS